MEIRGQIFLTTVVIILSIVIQKTTGYPDGAPSDACDSFIPTGHGVGAQGGTSNPYEIVVSNTNYSANEVIQVTLRSKDGTNILGFVIAAITVNHDSNRLTSSMVGSFAAISNTQQSCDNKALTHSTRLTSTSVVLQWTAPASTSGNIVFQATVVKERVVFWTDVESDVLTDGSVDPNATDPPTSSTTPVLDDFTIDLSQCGSSRGCFRRPSGCAADDCTVAASWTRPEGASYVEIELVGKQEGWIALGFSEDNRMDSDYVIRCIRNGETVSVENSYNIADGRFNRVFVDKSLGISEQKTSYSNGVLKCSFRREISVDAFRRKRQSSEDAKWFFNVDQGYILLLGYGASTAGQLLKHEETPVVTSAKITVTTDTDDVGASLTLLKVHGILMILAWIILIDISLLIARFYKDAWPEQKILKKQPWFPIHVFMNITAVVLTSIAFIIIFVQIGGYSQFSEDTAGTDKAHPVLGIIITALAFINPIMAIFRCAPDDPKRGIFNWFHWAVGIVAEILATINVFFGIGLGRSAAFTPSWVLWVLVGFVVFHGLTQIILEVHRCYLQQKDKASSQEMEMKSTDGHTGEQGLRFKYFVLALYILGTLACGLAVIIGIAVKE